MKYAVCNLTCGVNVNTVRPAYEVHNLGHFLVVLKKLPYNELTGLITELHLVRIQGYSSGHRKGFVKCFMKVLLACLGSMAAAVQPNGLGSFQKIFYKTFSMT